MATHLGKRCLLGQRQLVKQLLEGSTGLGLEFRPPGLQRLQMPQLGAHCSVLLLQRLELGPGKRNLGPNAAQLLGLGLDRRHQLLEAARGLSHLGGSGLDGSLVLLLESG